MSLISPVFVTYLITNLSGIPLLEIANDKKYKDNKEYAQYKASTPLLVPSLGKLLGISGSSGSSTKKEL
jgi:steroid 5-alpha reductase family enzyme